MSDLQASDRRLLAHLTRIDLFTEGASTPPVVLSVAPTLRCNLRCPFCPFRAVDPSVEGELDPDLLLRTVRVWARPPEGKRHALQSLEFTGGEPSLWEPLSRTILVCRHEEGLHIGVKSNGKILELAREVLAACDWIRISLNGLDEGRSIPRLPPGTGCRFHGSYVLHAGSDEGAIVRAGEWCAENGVPLRLVQDVFGTHPSAQADLVEAGTRLAERFRTLRVVSVSPERMLPWNGRCWAPWLKLHAQPSGRLLACCVHTDYGADGKLDERRVVGSLPRGTNVMPGTYRMACDACTYHGHNAFAENVFSAKQGQDRSFP
jgi:hypothetical protein